MSITFVTKNVNGNNGNIVGRALLQGKSYFYKLVSVEEMKRERDGWTIVSKYYPTATLVDARLHGDKGLLLYDYVESLETPGNMLADVLDDARLVQVLPKITSMYQEAYFQTRATIQTSSHNIFFSDRITTRIATFYGLAYRSKMSGKTVVINGVPIVIKLSTLLNKLTAFFGEEIDHSKYCVVSQADPAEYNIGTEPILLDYGASGYTPVMAEFATMLALTYFFGDYLARKYNPGFFVARNLRTVNIPVAEKTSIRRQISPWRAKFLRDYTTITISPLFGEEITFEQQDEFRNYFAMKVLAVFNISLFDEIEQEYLLGKLQYVYDMCIDCKTPEEITRLLLEN